MTAAVLRRKRLVIWLQPVALKTGSFRSLARTVVSDIGVNSKAGRSRGSGKGHPTVSSYVLEHWSAKSWARSSAFATSELALTPFWFGMFFLATRDFGQLLRFFPPHVAAVIFVVKQVGLSLHVMPLFSPEHVCAIISKSSLNQPVIRALGATCLFEQ